MGSWYCVKCIGLLIGSELEYFSIFFSFSINSAVAVVVTSSGHALGPDSHFGPCHQRSFVLSYLSSAARQVSWLLFTGRVSPRYFYFFS